MPRVPASMRPGADDLWDDQTLELQRKWHETKGTAEHAVVEQEMQRVMWAKRSRIVHEDRARHPRARRNQTLPVITGITGDGM